MMKLLTLLSLLILTLSFGAQAEDDEEEDHQEVQQVEVKKSTNAIPEKKVEEKKEKPGAFSNAMRVKKADQEKAQKLLNQEDE